jgi:hypothetical protein
MKINLVVTSEGFRCAQDEDFEKKRTLKRGTVVECVIKEYRNFKFHKLYFSLINLSWEYLTEQQRAFFKENVDAYRKTVEVAAGHYEPVYSVARQSWLEVPKSIAFDKLDEASFHDLYERVKNVIFQTFIPNANKEQFEYEIRNF